MFGPVGSSPKTPAQKAIWVVVFLIIMSFIVYVVLKSFL